MVVNCDQVWREISNYVDGEIDATLRSAMDEHFHTCQRCTSVLEGMRNVIQLYGDERMLEAPSGFGRRLEKRVAQTVSGRAGWSTWSAWLIPVAALLLIAGGLRLASSLTVSPPLRSEHAQAGHDIPPDMLVVVSADAKLFHLAGCDAIHNKDKVRTLTAKEAIRQGYVPCTRCLRKYVDVAERRGTGGGLEQGSDASPEAQEDEKGDLHGAGN